MPGHSGQNFLRLLFGGLDQGIDNFSRGQERQQDLELNLHQMQAKKTEADRAFGLQTEKFEHRVSQDEAAANADSAALFLKKNTDFQDRSRQSFLDAQSRFTDKRKLAISQQNANANTLRAQATVARATTDGTGDPTQERLAIGKLLDWIVKDPLSYHKISEKTYNKLNAQDKLEWESKIGKDETLTYRRMKSISKEALSRNRARLDQIGGTGTPISGPANDSTNVDDFSDFMSTVPK